MAYSNKLPRFDWRKFCRAHGVPFVEKGPNTARNHISIQCPYCGADDTGHHMGLSLDRARPAWGCWRSSAHRGVHPLRLVQTLLGVPRAVAVRVIAESEEAEDPVTPSLVEHVATVLGYRPKPDDAGQDAGELPAAVSLPHGARPLYGPPARLRAAEPFLRYLRSRGYEEPEEVARRYGMHYSIMGRESGRIVMPLRERGETYGWTARAATAARIRYLTSTYGDEKRRLFNLRAQCTSVVVTEGPFDCIKVDYFTPDTINAVALLGVVAVEDQRYRLVRLLRSGIKLYLLLDRETLSQTLELQQSLQELSGVRVHVLNLPPHVKDPGEMTEEDVLRNVVDAI